MINLLFQDEIIDISEIESYVSNNNVCRPFNVTVVSFINDFSKELLSSRYRNYPELQALAYWFRDKKIKKFASIYSNNNLPIGTVFHICPSNVDTIFVYSLFISLLMGNVNIVRISSKDSEVINIIVDIFKNLFNKKEYNFIQKNILLLSYERNDEITKSFSLVSNLRVFWGGDSSISHLRKIPAQSYTNDIYFPDRESICCIKASSFLNLDNCSKLSLFNKFVKDIKTFNQQACSSPLRLYWIGNQDSFSTFLSQNSLSQYNLDLTHSENMDKFVSLSSMAIDSNDLTLLNDDNSKIIFVHSASFNISLDSHIGNGVILVYFLDSIEDIVPSISPKTQTLSHFGFSKSDFDSLFTKLTCSQIDRVCKVGSSLDFDHVWDGKDLFLNFSRVIKVDI